MKRKADFLQRSIVREYVCVRVVSGTVIMGTHICDRGFTRGRSKHCDFFEQNSQTLAMISRSLGLPVCHLSTFESSVILSPRFPVSSFSSSIIQQCVKHTEIRNQEDYNFQ